MAEKNSVNVELYDMPLTERTDDRFGRVVTNNAIFGKFASAEGAARMCVELHAWRRIMKFQTTRKHPFE